MDKAYVRKVSPPPKTALNSGFLHFRYLKLLVMDWVGWCWNGMLGRKASNSSPQKNLEWNSCPKQKSWQKIVERWKSYSKTLFFLVGSLGWLVQGWLVRIQMLVLGVSLWWYGEYLEAMQWRFLKFHHEARSAVSMVMVEIWVKPSCFGMAIVYSMVKDGEKVCIGFRLDLAHLIGDRLIPLQLLWVDRGISHMWAPLKVSLLVPGT